MAVDFRLLAITDRHLYDPSPLPVVIQTFSNCGIRAVLVRERDLDLPSYISLFNDVKAASGIPARIIAHSHFEFAEEVNADIHLSESQLGEISNIRGERGSNVLIGASVHSVESALLAQEADASYVLFGPVFDTPLKRQFGPPQGLKRLREVTARVTIPVFAVGGIIPSRVSACLEAGSFGVACISALDHSQQIMETVNAFRESLGSL